MAARGADPDQKKSAQGGERSKGVGITEPALTSVYRGRRCRRPGAHQRLCWARSNSGVGLGLTQAPLSLKTPWALLISALRVVVGRAARFMSLLSRRLDNAIMTICKGWTA